MAKRWRKQKAGQQQKKQRRPARGSGDASGASGTLGGFRRATKGLFGSGGSKKPKTTFGKILDVALWMAVVVAGYYVVSRQCMR